MNFLSRLGSGATLLLTLCAALAAGTGRDAVRIDGDVPKPGDWSADRIKTDLAQDLASITYTTHDQKKHTSVAVPLMALLRAAGVSTQVKPEPAADPKSKHRDLRLVVIVCGRDGYIATFSLAELLTDIGNRPAWIALDMDGEPLSEAESPMKLIVPDDTKPARWVHGIKSVTVMDISAATTQP